jgi:NADPH:quinone reductase-like Zn-dependent oxidoreductase
VGDRVFGLAESFGPLVTWGTYSEHVVLPEAHVVKIPEGCSYEDAASLPLVALTVLQTLKPARGMFPKAGAAAAAAAETGTGGGDDAAPRVLVLGGGGGTGTAAIQICRAWGAHVTATCSGAKSALCRELGADATVDYTRERPSASIPAGSLDVVIDCVGDPVYEHDALPLLKPDTGFYGAFILSSVDLGTNLRQLARFCRLNATWALRRRGVRYQLTAVTPDLRDMEELAALVAARRVRAVVDRVYPLEEAAAAHRHVEAGRTAGKVVLRIAGA